MAYDVRIAEASPTRLLAVRRRAVPGELKTVIPEALGVVWNHIRSRGIRPHGRNVAVYLNGRIDLEAGVEVEGDDPGEGEVFVSATPAGPVATTTHIGPYANLGEANRAIDDWIRSNGHTPAGPSWEVYGHWTEDPNQARTDVFVLLKAAPET